MVWQDGEFWLAYRVRRPVDYVPVEQARGFVDGSHELRTAYVPRLDSLSQSE